MQGGLTEDMTGFSVSICLAMKPSAKSQSLMVPSLEAEMTCNSLNAS